VLSKPSAKRPFTLQDHGYGAGLSRGVPVYTPAFAGTQCAYLRRDGQAELIRIDGYTPRGYTRKRSPVLVVTWLSVLS